jgi:hypothetical protein
MTLPKKLQNFVKPLDLHVKGFDWSMTSSKKFQNFLKDLKQNVNWNHSSALIGGTRYRQLRYVPRGAVPYRTERYRGFVAKSIPHRAVQKKLEEVILAVRYRKVTFSCFFITSLSS